MNTTLLVNIFGSRARFSEVLSRGHVGGLRILEEDVGEAAISEEIDGRVENCKDDKAKQRLKNKLLRMLDEHDYSSRREISEMCNQLSDAQGRAMETMHFFQWNTPSSRTEEKEKKAGGELDGQIGT